MGRVLPVGKPLADRQLTRRRTGLRRAAAARGSARHTGRHGPTEPALEAPASPLNVLIVDDNVDAAETLAMVLRVSGFDVQAVHSAQAALARVAERRPDVALLDTGLPDMSGNELGRRLRDESWGRDLLLVAVTGWGQQEDRARTAAAGFDMHLGKPADAQKVRDIIADFAARRGGVGRAGAVGG